MTILGEQNIKEHEVYSKRQHGLEYSSLWTWITGTGEFFKLRVCLYRDAFDFQSYGKIELFSKPLMQWQFLADIPYAKLRILKTTYVQERLDETSVECDLLELFKQARAILS